MCEVGNQEMLTIDEVKGEINHALEQLVVTEPEERQSEIHLVHRVPSNHHFQPKLCRSTIFQRRCSVYYWSLYHLVSVNKGAGHSSSL